MSLDVTLEAEDDSDAGLNKTITLKNVSYSYKFDRGITIYRLKILRVFQNMLKAIGGDYLIPPVIALDSGSTIRTIEMQCLLKGNTAAANGPIDDVENQMMEIMDFIDRYTYVADRAYLKIGDQIQSAASSGYMKRLIYRTNKGVEGKVKGGSFSWVSKKHAIIEFNFTFIECIDLDIY